MGTGKQMADYVRAAYAGGGGYIYGQSGAKWTEAKQQALERKYKQDPEGYSKYKYSAEYGSKWIGHNVWDCSGLTMRAAQAAGASAHHGSNSSYKYDCKEKGILTNNLRLPEGAYVYTGTDAKKPHIGTVTGEDEVIEAEGTKAGVVTSKLHGGKWHYWGLQKNVEFDFSPVPGPDPQTHSTLRRGDKGPEVVEMQEKLMAHGEQLPKYGADGDFGRETQTAVKSFQRSHGLKADGICGPLTWAELDKEEA